MFLWRCSWNAIPVQAVLARRINTISPLCKLCGQQNETIVHAIFHCQFARAVWLSSKIGLRTSALQGGFTGVITQVRRDLDQNYFSSFLRIMWAVWRSRNDVVYGGKQQNIQTCLSYYRRVEEDARILCSGTQAIRSPQEQLGNTNTWDPGGVKCFVDGSWAQGEDAGIGMVLYCDGRLIEWVSVGVHAISATQAEAKDVVEGLKMIQKYSPNGGTVYSDSMDIVSSLKGPYSLILDWRSYLQIWQAWSLISTSEPQLRCHHRNRNEEEIKRAHILANKDRTNCWYRIRNSEDFFNTAEELY